MSVWSSQSVESVEIVDFFLLLLIRRINQHFFFLINSQHSAIESESIYIYILIGAKSWRICYQTFSFFFFIPKRKMKFMVSYVLDPRATSCCYSFRVSRLAMLLLAVRHHLIPIGPYYRHYWNHILRRRMCMVVPLRAFHK